MKPIAVAIVLAATTAASVIGDMGLMSAKDGEAWDVVLLIWIATFSIVLATERKP